MNKRWQILVSQIAADTEAACMNWHETVWQVTFDLESLYYRMAAGTHERELVEILSRLVAANVRAEKMFKELRDGYVCH